MTWWQVIRNGPECEPVHPVSFQRYDCILGKNPYLVDTDISYYASLHIPMIKIRQLRTVPVSSYALTVALCVLFIPPSHLSSLAKDFLLLSPVFCFFFPPPLAFLLCILPLIRPLWSDRMKVGTLYMGSLQAQPPSLTAPITLARPRHPRLWKVSRHWDSLWVTETDSSCVCGYRQQYRSWWR